MQIIVNKTQPKFSWFSDEKSLPPVHRATFILLQTPNYASVVEKTALDWHWRGF